MTATGNEPVKLSQFKAELSKGIVTRRIVTFTITDVNTPYELPFAEKWGIFSDETGTYTAEFIDYGNILELSMLYRTSQANTIIRICSKEDSSSTANKFGRMYGNSHKTSIILVNSYDSTATLGKINTSLAGGYGEFQSSVLIYDGTMYANSPLIYIQLYFEK